MDDSDKNFKIILVMIVFFILLVVQNLVYADIFLPYYRLIPEAVQTQVPGILMLFLFFINLGANFIILFVLMKLIYEYEKFVPIVIASNVTTFFQVLLTVKLVQSSIELFGTVEKTTVLGCLIEGSGIFAIALPILFILNVFVIRYIFKMKEAQFFYGLSMSILLNPMYHYVLFYTPILKLLNLTQYVF